MGCAEGPGPSAENLRETLRLSLLFILLVFLWNREPPGQTLSLWWRFRKDKAQRFEA
jgi:hypothetical protein